MHVSLIFAIDTTSVDCGVFEKVSPNEKLSDDDFTFELAPNPNRIASAFFTDFPEKPAVGIAPVKIT
jgi:hypothetical protein